MKVRLPCQRLLTPPRAHRIKRNMQQPNIYTLDIRLTKSRRTKVARQELQQTKVRRNQVINMLLALRQRRFIRGGEFLLAVEGVGVAKRGAEEAARVAHRGFPFLRDGDEEPGFHAGVLLGDAGPEGDAEFDGLLGEDGEGDADEVLYDCCLVRLDPT